MKSEYIYYFLYYIYLRSRWKSIRDKFKTVVFSWYSHPNHETIVTSPWERFQSFMNSQCTLHTHSCIYIETCTRCNYSILLKLMRRLNSARCFQVLLFPLATYYGTGTGIRYKIHDQKFCLCFKFKRFQPLYKPVVNV